MKDSAHITEWLQLFREGKHELAYSLLEAVGTNLPELLDAFDKESDAEIQAFLVQLIWQQRQPSAIPFLGNALLSQEPLIWKEAMDGLVVLTSPESLEVLLSARTQQFPKKQDTVEFQEWLEEAIEQVREKISI